MSKTSIIIILLYSVSFVLSCSGKASPGSAAPAKSDKPKLGAAVIDEASIHEKMKGRAQDFNKCFEKEMAKDKDFKVEKVMSLFTLSGDGLVKASGVVSVHPLTDEFKSCFKNIISRMSFDPISTEKPFLIFYPVEYTKTHKTVSYTHLRAHET